MTHLASRGASAARPKAYSLVFRDANDQPIRDHLDCEAVETQSAVNLPSDVTRIDQLVAHWARRTPDAIACVIDDERLSYAALHERIEILARALLAAGVVKGDRVATLSPPNPDYLTALLACASIGAIWVGLNPRYRLEELKHIILDSEPKVLLTRTLIDGRSYENEIAILSATACISHIVILDAGPPITNAERLENFLWRADAVNKKVLNKTRAGVGGREPCMIVYTSGSTGRPKGALLHHHGILRFSQEQNRIWPVSPLVSLNYFPINHIGCVVDISLPTLAAGGSIVFMEQFDPTASLALMEREGVTLWGSVPSVFQIQLSLPDFAHYDLSAVQLILWEGAAMAEPLIKRLRDIKPRLATNYGMTETTSAITILEPTHDLDALVHSVGAAFPGVEIKLVGPDGSAVAAGEAGEVWARSEYNFLGYWRRPEATAEAFTADGYFRTGDLAVLRPDGSYQIVGRIKEMYKSGGYNVYPREIETVLEEHPDIALAAVVAIPDPIWQEVGIAFVTSKQPIDLADLERHCRERLANYKVPKQIIVEPNLPLLPIGKIDKTALKHRAMRDL